MGWWRRFWLWVSNLFKRLEPVGAFTLSYISHEGNMERYRVDWTPSPSTFVDYIIFYYRVDGGAPVASDHLTPNTTSFTLVLPSGGVCEVWVVVYGDNGTSAESRHHSFDIKNLEPVQPIGGITVTWLAHEP